MYQLKKKTQHRIQLFLFACSFISPYRFDWTLLVNSRWESPFGKSDKDWITFTTYSKIFHFRFQVYNE